MPEGLNPKRIPIAGPWITEKEIRYVKDAVTNAWYGKANMYHDRFEKAFADYLNVRFAIALPSCTSAIHLALLGLGIHPNDEVIVPDVTWIASSAPVSYVGAKTVFSDIDSKSWCLSAESFLKCITPRTKAVIPVDLYGNISDMDTIRDIAERHNIMIIEDAAEAMGSEYKGRKAGSFGHAGVFSFHGSKMLTTGEGGMLVTNDEKLYRRCLFLRDHGRRPGDTLFFNAEIAYKYKMSSLQAALGLAQLERVRELIERKRTIFRYYADHLKDVSGIILNDESPDVKNTFWMVTIIVQEKISLKKETLIALMAKKGIDCRPFFNPLSSIPAYRDLKEAKRARQRNVVSYALSPYGINLPSHLMLSEDDVVYVCDVLKDILRQYRK